MYHLVLVTLVLSTLRNGYSTWSVTGVEDYIVSWNLEAAHPKDDSGVLGRSPAPMARDFLGRSCTAEAAVSREVPPTAKRPPAVAEMTSTYGSGKCRQTNCARSMSAPIQDLRQAAAASYSPGFPVLGQTEPLLSSRYSLQISSSHIAPSSLHKASSSRAPHRAAALVVGQIPCGLHDPATASDAPSDVIHCILHSNCFSQLPCGDMLLPLVVSGDP